MGRPPAKELTDRELEIMQVFWRRGEMNVADVRDTLAAEGLDRAYTTVATLVRILAEKRFLEQTNDERPFRFRPARTYDDVAGRLLTDLVDRVFAGSRERLLMHLFDEQRLTTEERSAIESLLKDSKR